MGAPTPPQHAPSTPSASAVLSTLATAALVLAWYFTNIMLLLANKYLMTATGFRQPVFLALCHMSFCALVSSLMAALGLFPTKAFSFRLLGKVTVLSVAFAAAIVFSMASLAYIPASFAQALGSTTPVFTALMAYLIQGRREANTTYIALLPVVLGIVIASGGEPLFHTLGMVLQLLAGAARALKTVLQAVLLTDPSEKFHPMSLLMYTSAVSVVLLLPLLVAAEPHALQRTMAASQANPSFVPLLLVSCAVAFLVNWCNFVVTKVLGALTLQVLGNAKNVVAAGVAVAVFGNPVTATGIAGYGVTMGGVSWYSYCVKLYKHDVAVPPLMALSDAAVGVAARWRGSHSGRGDAEEGLLDEAAKPLLSSGGSSMGGGQPAGGGKQ